MAPETSEDSLSRFETAQDPVWSEVMAELRAGHKRTHWMWFVFPQLRGLGRSGTARFYGIADLAEARAYVGHPVLGPRLVQAAEALLAHRGTLAEEILGGIDALKLRSSATLFQQAGAARQDDLLAAFFDGAPDPVTMQMIEGATE